MPSLRTITGTILRPDGSPWRGARVTAQLVPGSFTPEHTFPAAFVQAVAGPDGSFSMELWANAEAESASVYRIKTPDDDPFEVVVPEGSGPMTLSELRQLGVPTINPQYGIIQGFLVENPETFRGQEGMSAYEVYLETTEDDPPLSDVAWLESLRGEDGDGLVFDERLIGWTEAEAYEPTSITRDSDGVVTTATVKWPDGSAGTFTTTTKNTTFLAVDAYTVSHADSGKTVTQAAVTRNANGDVTAKPALTVS